MGRIEPGPGRESVWDYPRPPRVEPAPERIRVEFAGETVVDTDRAVRVLETSHPPTYYVPREAIRPGVTVSSPTSTSCEFKGRASYLTLRLGDRESVDAGWWYPAPARGFEALTDMVAFYPGRVDACYVGEERVTPQAGDFYGGWITSRIVGPFKGGPGTFGW
jgi:uncharacterized protein (DUF427 family)